MQNSPMITEMEAFDWSKLSEQSCARTNAGQLAAERIGIPFRTYVPMDPTGAFTSALHMNS